MEFIILTKKKLYKNINFSFEDLVAFYQTSGNDLLVLNERCSVKLFKFEVKLLWKNQYLINFKKTKTT